MGRCTRTRSASRGWIFAALLALPLCAGSAIDANATDLGEGNRAMKTRFDAWKERGPKSKASDAPRRVMVTGFGLFSGVDYNISGVTVASMADPAFWPATVSLADLPEAGAEHVASGKLVDADLGAKHWQRSLEIDGVTYEVCFLVLDVLWDLGAAIVLEEARRFQPHLIVMTGRGGRRTVFESGAVNSATGYSGFRYDGAPDRENVPATPHVIDPALPGVEAAIPMTWDAPRLAAAAKPIIEAMGRGHEVYAAPRARPENNYICNNISCAVLHGIARKDVALAGGEIRIEDIALPDTAAGFLHLPAAAQNTPAEVQAWCHVLARVMKTHFAEPEGNGSADPDEAPEDE